ncbi:MAG: hypothetical protein PVG22_05700 [Chromatiales bacterium]|jgi:multimeric flavodoxin WrbA
MTRILAVNGCYRENGAIGLAAQTAEAAGAIVEVVNLRDFPIEYCRNCRQCTQNCWHADYQEAPSDGSAWGETNGGDRSLRVLRGGGHARFFTI